MRKQNTQITHTSWNSSNDFCGVNALSRPMIYKQ